MIFGGIGAGFSFGLGVLTCYFAFRAGVQLTLRLMKRADEDYSDPFTAEQVPEIQQEVTE
jgi:hypothetical protein